MNPLKKLFLLFAFILIAFPSCNISKKVSTASSASYQKLQIIQQSNSQKENIAATKATAPGTKQNDKYNLTLVNPAPEKVNYHPHGFKSKFSKVVTPCAMLASIGKAQIIIRQAKDMSSESTPKIALKKLGIAFLILVCSLIVMLIGGLLVANELFGVNSGVVLLGVLGIILLIAGLIGAIVGFIVFVVRLFQLIAQLLKESIRSSIKDPKSALKDARSMNTLGWVLFVGGIVMFLVVGNLQSGPVFTALLTTLLTISLIMFLIGIILLIISSALRGAAHERMSETSTK